MMKQLFKEKMQKWVQTSLAVLMTAIIVSSCSKEESKDDSNGSVTETAITKSVSSDGNILLMYEGLDAQTMWELQQARAATAKYRHLDKALKDGYVDIGVVVQGMGHHFMKMDLVDGTFDIRKPEILVYNPDENGVFHLVAVEYAIPLEASPMAPEGFSGDNDVWSPNGEVGLWLLHAWVWKYNPLGVFSPVNPTVVLNQ